MAERSAYRIPIRLNLRYKENGRYYSGITKNLSENGIFVISDEVTIIDTPLITIELPVKKSMLKLSGKRVRSIHVTPNKSGFGVLLDNPPLEYTDYIEELLLSL